MLLEKCAGCIEKFRIDERSQNDFYVFLVRIVFLTKSNFSEQNRESMGQNLGMLSLYWFHLSVSVLLWIFLCNRCRYDHSFFQLIIITIPLFLLANVPNCLQTGLFSLNNFIILLLGSNKSHTTSTSTCSYISRITVKSALAWINVTWISLKTMKTMSWRF